MLVVWETMAASRLVLPAATLAARCISPAAAAFGNVLLKYSSKSILHSKRSFCAHTGTGE